MKRILVAEDESAIRDFVVINLKRVGYDVVDVPSGEAALEEFSKSGGDFDVVLLDVMMPGIDGFEVCKQIRAKSGSTGIIMLTAKTQEMDKVSGLMLGADDYVTKPFGNNELLARIRTAVRLHEKALGDRSGDDSVFSAGSLVIDHARRKVAKDGQPIHLTPIEFKIVALLSQSAGRVLTRDFIITRVWGGHHEGDDQILRVYMANIRRKLEDNPADPRYILTEVGVGYRMIEPE